MSHQRDIDNPSTEASSRNVPTNVGKTFRIRHSVNEKPVPYYHYYRIKILSSFSKTDDEGSEP